MGGVTGQSIERIVSQGGQGNVTLEDGEEITSFDPSGTGITLPGASFLAEDRTISAESGAVRSFQTVDRVTPDWVPRSGGNVVVVSTPSESVGDENLNPLANVSNEEFLTAEGGQYVRESGVLEDSGLGSEPSWLVTPEQVGSTDTTLVGESVTVESYAGIAEDSSDAARTLLFHVARATLDEEIVIVAGFHHAPVFPEGVEDGRSSFSFDSYTPGEDLSGENVLLTEGGVQAAADELAAVSEQLSREG